MDRVTVDTLDLDGFLGHSGSAGGGAFLRDWKKDGKLDVWLHPRAGIKPLWSHPWYVVGKDRESDEPVLRATRINSMETEALLKRRHYRDEKTGEREFPPVVCPFSKLLEWVFQRIRDKSLSWTDEIFTWDEVDEPKIIHAGGFTGLFNAKDLTREELAELRRYGVRRDEAYMESGDVNLQYILRIVKHYAPQDGCLIAVEKKSLGDAVKKAIGDRIEAVGRVQGDPWTTPYAIRWKYDEKAEFSRKYAAVAMTALELSPEIQEVFDRDPPDIHDLCKPSNIAELRQSWEAHWCHKHIVPPWDDLFAAAEEQLAGTSAAEDPASFEFGANVQGVASTTGAVVEEDLVECDVCQFEMQATQFECPQCGTVYDPKTNKILTRGEWPKPEPTRRRRGAAK